MLSLSQSIFHSTNYSIITEKQIAKKSFRQCYQILKVSSIAPIIQLYLKNKLRKKSFRQCYQILKVFSIAPIIQL